MNVEKRRTVNEMELFKEFRKDESTYFVINSFQ